MLRRGNISVILYARIVNLRALTHDGELRVGNLLADNPESREDAIASFAVKLGAVCKVRKDALKSVDYMMLNNAVGTP